MSKLKTRNGGRHVDTEAPLPLGMLVARAVAGACALYILLGPFLARN